ncbi:hypothetical protein F5Y05DRAFT_415766 [Hypoxylon sp. FL0543]|nr:hypothetical protein F5Y05DRAFT_415766 [Hypoxylon sp. FL0543]
MAGSSQKCANGSGSVPPNSAVADTRTDQVDPPAQSILAYTAAVAKGDAPITTLLQQQDTEAELAARRAKVQKEVDAAMDKYSQASTKYVTFSSFVPKQPKTCFQRSISSIITGV